MTCARMLSLAIAMMLLAVPASPAAADEPAAKTSPAEPDYAAELPKIPPQSPDASLRTIRVRAGLHVELVASEPLVRSPMAMDFDEFGRAYVVELPEYNQYASSKSHGKGAIKRLEDTDGDGRYDRATVYVADLNYPTAVACCRGGILVGAAPDLWFCQDTDGDGQADVRRRLFTGFGQDKAGEGMLNSIRWRIDNRFQISTGLDGGDIVAVPDGNQAPSPAAPPLSARGQHLLLDSRGMSLTATSGGGQHGLTLDDWSLLALVCGNSEPAHLIMYDGRYLARNPYLAAPAAAVNIAPEGKFTKLMRISKVEPWRILRTRLRSAGTIPGSDEGGSPSGFFTGATGITFYRGDAWPEEYRGQVFVGEVANNLVYRARLEPNGIGYFAQRADADAEFLASADNWFRPVQFANAPDGTLYVLDMYRELIEGAAFLAPQILTHMDPSAGADKGRIYRIAPDGFQTRPAPRLGDLSTTELVPLLEHRNGWHRDTAARLIYERQDRAAVPALRALADQSASPLARTIALYALQGLDALDPARVIAALDASDPRARQHGLRLAESWADHPEVRAAVLKRVDDPDVRVRYQVAFTLGAFTGDSASQALGKLAVRDGADSWMQLAILSSAGSRRGALLSTLLADAAGRSRPQVSALLTELASQIGAANSRDELAELIRQLERLATQGGGTALAEQLVKGVIAKQPAAQEMLASAAGGKAAEILATIQRDALSAARDEKRPAAERAIAVKTLAAASFSQVRELFAGLLDSRQPQPVQTATLETLARFDEASVPQLVLTAWPSQTPQLRATSLETLFTRAAWIEAFLDAVSEQRIALADVDPARVALLKQHSHEPIRQRATQLFAGSALARRQDVVDSYQQALELTGDVPRGRAHFRKTCAACHKLEGVGESIGADLNAIRDRGTAAVLLNILDPNRECKPQFLNYVVVLESGRTLAGMIAAETATSLTIRKADNTSETVLRVDIESLKSTGLSFMPEGLEKQLDVPAMADLLAYLNSIK